MKKFYIFLVYILIQVYSSNSFASARIKDVVNFEGIRENVLIGYGLVIGLNGTGDNLTNTVFTQSRLVEMLQGLGVNAKGSNIKTKNIAAVMVTANLPPFARQGSKIDVTVSTIGDAKSLQDGTLLATPLLGADGQVYAVSQGQVMLSGYKGKDKDGNQINRNVVTNAFITNGAIIEKEIHFDLNQMTSMNLALQNPDLSTAQQISDAINLYYYDEIAKAIDSGTVKLTIPEKERENVVRFLSSIEQLTIYPDQPAKIIIDESSGTLVMGENVKISPVAISQGNLSVVIKSQQNIDNNIDLSSDENFKNQNKSNLIDRKKDEKGNQMVVMQEGVSIGELVDGLNSLGVGPRDLISILQAIKASGALQAAIELR